MEGVAMEVHGLKGTTTPVFVWWATSVYVWGFKGTGKRLDLLLYSVSLEYDHGWLKGAIHLDIASGHLAIQKKPATMSSTHPNFPGTITL